MPQAPHKSKPKPKPKDAKSSSAASAASNRKQLGPSAKAPRNARVAKRRADARRSAAGLTTAMERRLAERAGYTEMIGGKDGRGGARREGKEKGKADSTAGGSGKGVAKRAGK